MSEEQELLRTLLSLLTDIPEGQSHVWCDQSGHWQAIELLREYFKALEERPGEPV